MLDQSDSKRANYYLVQLVRMSVFIFLLTSYYPAFSADIYVKYRGIVDTEMVNKRTGRPYFDELRLKSSSLVKGMYYDQENNYLLVQLRNTWYHYCEIPPKEVRSWQYSQSLGSHYHSFIKGGYDCRTGFVPKY